MKKLFITLLLLLSFNAHAFKNSSGFTLPILLVYDGDTIKSEVDWQTLPDPLNHISIRIYGIDTPEMPAKSYAKTGKLGRAQCRKEAKLAIKAKKYLLKLIGRSREIRLQDYKWGRNGGRIVAKVYIDCVDIGQAMIKAGHAVEYFGKGTKHDWCQ